MPNYKIPVSVLVVIYTPALETLIIERADYANAWQSVTGSVEADESLRETAAREVLEETGFQAGMFQLQDWGIENRWEIFEVWRHRYAPGVTENTEHVFGLLLPETLTPTLSPREHTSFIWRNWETAAEAVFSPSNAEALRMLPEIAKRFDVANIVAGHA